MKDKTSYSKQLNSYLVKVDETSVSDLSTDQAKEVFFLAREDFKEGKLSLDDFADLCNYLFSDAIKDKDKATPFATMLQNTAELNYYIRKADNEETANIVAVNLKNSLGYE